MWEISSVDDIPADFRQVMPVHLTVWLIHYVTVSLAMEGIYKGLYS